MIKATILQRLDLLRDEYEKGQRQLTALDWQRQEVHDTLLRISGAIQVLEELQTVREGVHDEAHNGVHDRMPGAVTCRTNSAQAGEQ